MDGFRKPLETGNVVRYHQSFANIEGIYGQYNHAACLENADFHQEKGVKEEEEKGKNQNTYRRRPNQPTTSCLSISHLRVLWPISKLEIRLSTSASCHSLRPSFVESGWKVIYRETYSAGHSSLSMGSFSRVICITPLSSSRARTDFGSVHDLKTHITWMTRSRVTAQTHFAHVSAFLPVFLLTTPNLDKQKMSSDKAEKRSIKRVNICPADIGSGDKRSVMGCNGFNKSKHFLGSVCRSLF